MTSYTILLMIPSYIDSECVAFHFEENLIKSNNNERTFSFKT